MGHVASRLTWVAEEETTSGRCRGSSHKDGNRNKLAASGKSKKKLNFDFSKRNNRAGTYWEAIAASGRRTNTDGITVVSSKCTEMKLSWNLYRAFLRKSKLLPNGLVMSSNLLMHQLRGLAHFIEPPSPRNRVLAHMEDAILYLKSTPKKGARQGHANLSTPGFSVYQSIHSSRSCAYLLCRTLFRQRVQIDEAPPIKSIIQSTVLRFPIRFNPQDYPTPPPLGESLSLYLDQALFTFRRVNSLILPLANIMRFHPMLHVPLSRCLRKVEEGDHNTFLTDLLFGIPSSFTDTKSSFDSLSFVSWLLSDDAMRNDEPFSMKSSDHHQMRTALLSSPATGLSYDNSAGGSSGKPVVWGCNNPGGIEGICVWDTHGCPVKGKDASTEDLLGEADELERLWTYASLFIDPITIYLHRFAGRHRQLHFSKLADTMSSNIESKRMEKNNRSLLEILAAESLCPSMSSSSAAHHENTSVASQLTTIEQETGVQFTFPLDTAKVEQPSMGQPESCESGEYHRQAAERSVLLDLEEFCYAEGVPMNTTAPHAWTPPSGMGVTGISTESQLDSCSLLVFVARRLGLRAEIVASKDIEDCVHYLVRFSTLGSNQSQVVVLGFVTSLGIVLKPDQLPAYLGVNASNHFVHRLTPRDTTCLRLRGFVEGWILGRDTAQHAVDHPTYGNLSYYYNDPTGGEPGTSPQGTVSEPPLRFSEKKKKPKSSSNDTPNNHADCKANDELRRLLFLLNIYCEKNSNKKRGAIGKSKMMDSDYLTRLSGKKWFRVVCAMELLLRLNRSYLVMCNEVIRRMVVANGLHKIEGTREFSLLQDAYKQHVLTVFC